MASAMSKRHQARNERALQELIKSIPGNERCADCDARNPGWASWNLGIFLCMRCAALHRKLGTHISKVKSLSMDGWSNDQVDSIKSRGNAASNKLFNPKNAQPPVPLDADEFDGAMERFIRHKYEQRIYSARASQNRQQVRSPERNRAVSTTSSDDNPPPPPPKPGKSGKRFGFGLRTASSALTLSRNSPGVSPEASQKYGKELPPIRVHKSRVFGGGIGVTEGMEWKLVTLKEMGFPDDNRNSNVLKGLNGDLERAIESLVRLGEGSQPASGPRTSMSATFTKPEPIPSPAEARTQPTSASSAPAISSVQPQTLLGNPIPSAQSSSYNPFENIALAHPAAQPPLEQAFQNMHVTQPLFPNATGGYPNQPPMFSPTVYQQPMTPPIPQMHQQYAQSNPYAQQHQSATYNPFVTARSYPSPPMSANPYLSTQQNTGSSNPYHNQTGQPGLNPPVDPQQFQLSLFHPNQTQPMPPQQSLFQQNQPQQNPYQQPQQQQQQQQQQFWGQTQQGQAPPQQLFNGQANMPREQNPYLSPTFPAQYHQTMQPLAPQATGRVDKASILALYNYPQLAPQPPAQSLDGQNHSDLTSSPQVPSARLPPGVNGLGPRSATMPVFMASGNKNPFSRSTAPSIPKIPMNAGGRHASNDSMENGSIQSGRHSPDAFASLSARFVR